MKKKIGILAVLLILTAAAVIYCTGGKDILARKNTELVLYGNIDDRQVNLPFQISERVKRVLVEEGSVVKKGELLGELETIRLENNVRAAEAALKAAQAVLKKAKNGPRKEEIEMARAEVAAIQAKIKAAENDYFRQENLRKRDIVSVQIAENAESLYLLQKAQLAEAQSKLDMLLAGTRSEEIESAEAQMLQAEAALKIQNQYLADAHLRSPCDGIVRSRELEPGEMATAQTTAFVIAVVSPKWIRVYLAESMLPKVKIGDKAEITFDGLNGKSFEGWIGYISPTAEFTPKNVETTELRTSLVYEMRVYVKDPENILKLGAPATVRFPGVMIK